MNLVEHHPVTDALDRPRDDVEVVYVEGERAGYLQRTPLGWRCDVDLVACITRRTGRAPRRYYWSPATAAKAFTARIRAEAERVWAEEQDRRRMAEWRRRAACSPDTP